MEKTLSDGDEKDYTSSVYFAVVGYDLDPEFVSATLSLSPSRAWKKGDKRIYKSGGEHVSAWGGWQLVQKKEHLPLILEKQIETWLDLLSSKAEGVKSLQSAGLWVSLSCYVSVSNSATLELLPEMLAKLGNLGIILDWNIFSHPEDRGASKTNLPET